MPGTHAWILDLDGTLMPSSEVDNRCYWQAVADVFGAPARAPSLDGFRHVTDAGILDEWCRDHIGRPPCPMELETTRERFLERTREAAKRHPGSFTPFPGLLSWLRRRRDAGHAVAIATGGWAHTARFKLDVAGLGRLGLPLSSADDAMTRTDIMRLALERLDGPRRATYIGDAPWDARAASQLGWAFIGRATGHDAQALRTAGAARVVADFSGLD